MKIIELTIENFGKLHDCHIKFDNLVCLCRENGFGKTTLATFIKAMFYGMPKKGNNKAYNAERSKYKPWQGGIYGGTITFECNEGKYKCYRTFGETPEGDTFEIIDVKTGLKTDKFTKNLGYELFNVGVETFEITAFFPQLDIVSHINDEVRASLTGANKFENDLSNFTAAQKSLNEKLKYVKKQCLSKSELEKLVNTNNMLETNIKSFQSENNQISENLSLMTSEKDKLEKEISMLEDERKELKKYNEEKQKLESEIFNIQNQISENLTINNEKMQKNTQKDVKYTKKTRILAIIITILGLLITGGVIALGVLKIFNVSIAIAVALVVLLGTRFAISFISKHGKQEKVSIVNNDNGNFTKLNEELNKKKGELAKYKDNKTFDEDNYNARRSKLYEIEKQISILNINLANGKKELERSKEEKENIESLLEQKQQEDEKARFNIKVIEKTLELMKIAQQNVSSRFMTPMQNNFDKYFDRLSSKNINLNINFEASESTGQGEKEEGYLSQGYRDIVSVCKRLALIENIYKKDKPCIILDDPFVNLDAKNLEIMKTIIKDFSKDYQIIYLCCNEKTKL